MKLSEFITLLMYSLLGRSNTVEV